ncbi:hypothetical protein A3K79_05980 [Candidatus Bathyarchaeota archaeon RBG_13_46_16b]|nr:MAG: hypothetical protein A3K79_05980 [Candidatus Bathyarchaeota archaeon RBG_13_46_16b]
MADLLRQGSALTELACPVCASPLFRLRNGDIWCAKCEKRVIVVKEDEEVETATKSIALEKLEATLLAKVQEIQDKMQRMENQEELQKLGTTLSGLLDNIEKTRKAKRA